MLRAGEKLFPWFMDDFSNESADVDHLFYPPCSCSCWRERNYVWAPCMCDVGLFCASLCLWIDIHCVSMLHQYFLCHCAVPLGQRNRWSCKTRSQQSLPCHWTEATWLDSSFAKVFEHSDVSVFRWTILTPARDESLIWWVTAPKSFKLQGLLTSAINCLEVDSSLSLFFFFNSELEVKHQDSSYNHTKLLFNYFLLKWSFTDDKTSWWLLVLDFKSSKWTANRCSRVL